MADLPPNADRLVRGEAAAATLLEISTAWARRLVVLRGEGLVLVTRDPVEIDEVLRLLAPQSDADSDDGEHRWDVACPDVPCGLFSGHGGEHTNGQDFWPREEPLRITLDSTTDFAMVDGANARIWTGHTEDGVPVEACIAAIGVDAEHDTTRFDAELLELTMGAPRGRVQRASGWLARAVLDELAGDGVRQETEAALALFARAVRELRGPHGLHADTAQELMRVAAPWPDAGP